MTRPEHLAALVADMAKPAATEIIRAALRTFTAAEYEQWEAMKNAARQARFRARQAEKSNGSNSMATVTLEESGFPPVPPSGKEDPGKEEKNPLRGEKEKKTAPELFCPADLDTADFRQEFKRWMQFRRGLGKKPKDWQAMFEEQLRWLAPFGAPAAIAILGQSIRNGWQGLFELKTTASPAAQPRAAPPAPLPAVDRPGFGRWFQSKYPAARITIDTAYDDQKYRHEYLSETR